MNVHYVTYATSKRLGLYHACDPTDFDGAVDAYVKCMDADTPATVFRMEPPKVTRAGMMVDVTEDANARVAQLCRLRRVDAPVYAVGECMLPPADDYAAENRMDWENA